MHFCMSVRNETMYGISNTESNETKYGTDFFLSINYVGFKSIKARNLVKNGIIFVDHQCEKGMKSLRCPTFIPLVSLNEIQAKFASIDFVVFLFGSILRSHPKYRIPSVIECQTWSSYMMRAPNGEFRTQWSEPWDSFTRQRREECQLLAATTTGLVNELLIKRRPRRIGPVATSTCSNQSIDEQIRTVRRPGCYHVVSLSNGSKYDELVKFSFWKQRQCAIEVRAGSTRGNNCL